MSGTNRVRARLRTNRVRARPGTSRVRAYSDASIRPHTGVDFDCCRGAAGAQDAQRDPLDERRATLAGRVPGGGRAVDDRRERPRREYSQTTPGVLAGETGSAARGADAVLMDGRCEAGPNLRKSGAGFEGFRHQWEEFLLSGLNEILCGFADPRID